MNTSLISLTNISKKYLIDGESSYIIRDLNLEIKKGEFTIIMGPSGSGKSTLLYLMSGMDTVSSGEIMFDKKNLMDLKDKELSRFRRDKLGFVFQGIHLIPYLSLLQNILLSGYLKSTNRKIVKENAINLLKSFGLEQHKNKLPSQVSGGQNQRAAIARALINKPEVLFADEPTGSLNSNQGLSILNLLTQLNKDGQSIVLVTHDVKAAIRGDRLLFINDGKLDGELYLGTYQEDNTLEREKILIDYLNTKGW